MKMCLRCSQELDLTHFQKDKNRRDGLSIYCRMCRAVSRWRKTGRSSTATGLGLGWVKSAEQRLTAESLGIALDALNRGSSYAVAAKLISTSVASMLNAFSRNGVMYPSRAEVRAIARKSKVAEVCVDGVVATVPLHRKGVVVAVALVDASDAPLVGRFNWFLNGSGYAQTKSKDTPQLMHRMVLPGVEIVDHVNQDKLDNRRSNLRAATATQNSQNARVRTGRKYKGTRRADGRWMAIIKVDGKTKTKGGFPSEEAAARKYDEMARMYFGEYASPNFKE